MKPAFSTSSIEERVIRAIEAMNEVESAITGMTRYGHCPPCQPPPGSHASQRVKTRVRSGAMTKFGSTWAPIETPTARWSSTELWRTAAAMPSETPTTTATRNDHPP